MKVGGTPSCAGPESSTTAVSGDDARWQCDDGVPAALEATPSAHGLASCRPSPLGPETRSEWPVVPGGLRGAARHCQPRRPPGTVQEGKGRWGPSTKDRDPGRERAEALQALLLVLPENGMLSERDVPQPAIPPRLIRTHPNSPVLTPPVCGRGGRSWAGPSTRLDKSSRGMGTGVPCQSPACQISRGALGSARRPATAWGPDPGQGVLSQGTGSCPRAWGPPPWAQGPYSQAMGPSLRAQGPSLRARGPFSHATGTPS